MKGSSDRIRVSHAGVLPRPPDYQALADGLPSSAPAFAARTPSAVKEVVEMQVARGVDVVNDGEVARRGGFSGYIRERMSGLTQREWKPGERPNRASVDGRDRRNFPAFYETGRGSAIGGQGNATATFVVEPVRYVGHAEIQQDVDNLKQAAAGLDVELYLPGIAPGTMEHGIWNDYYPDDESFLFGLADVLHEEFKLITDAGIIVQIDDPDLPDGWQMFPDWSIQEYRRYAELRVDAINRAIEGLPEELVRFHICWGSQHGPHSEDLPLKEFIDLVYKVKARCYSIEAANPQHEHEWRVFEEAPLPDGKLLMPGVVGHTSDVIENPQTVADRLVRYANIVGKENVIAGTDCGLGSFGRMGGFGGREIAWAKIDALGKGAALASRELWA